MLHRIGNVVHWLGIILLVLFIVMGIFSEINNGMPFWACLGIGLTGYIIGRTLKYILGD
jgi:membrane protein DedA with SNARE-associated domain